MRPMAPPSRSATPTGSPMSGAWPSPRRTPSTCTRCRPTGTSRRPMAKSALVVAIGGNSLIKDPQHMTVPDQYRALGETSRHIARIIKDGWQVAIGHGNGPQVGFILRRSELSAHELHEVPLDVCDADTQGAIGYELQQNLGHDFRRMRIDRQAVTVVTQVEVDPNDPAFQHPSKPIGSFMDEAQAQQRAEREGWVVREDAGRGWRRVVASPRPLRIVEERAVKALLRDDFVVITVGGGGIPVITDEHGDLHGGGEAVITNPENMERALAGEAGTRIVA